ncbi:hypothetical protein FSP39_014795 [Pinctada imbricata]|uniref:G-protein coupled receptors family 1 profile domain-containing protein n=1 Tax=Pinctada imbricata TaxID=66713 RepID=A0AA88YVF7_PINIB|nr:hypothetical protein FSP39_014795 [Pinctada imbricata]
MERNDTAVFNGTTLPPFFHEEYTILIPSIWAVIIIVGCIGNGLVIYTLCKNGEMTPTNCYVVNLAAADLTFIIVVVTISAIAFGMPDWALGDPMCKISVYMIYCFGIVRAIFPLFLVLWDSESDLPFDCSALE